MSTVAKVLSVAPVGFEGYVIEVESDATKGLPSLQIVGMGNKAIDEAKERVKSAISNSLLEYPARRITIYLAPAELPKDGTHYDLPIALAVLVSSGQLRQAEVQDAIFAGELALDGSLRPIKGATTMAEIAKSKGINTLYIPSANVDQASLVEGVIIIGIDSLKSLYLHLKQEAKISPRMITSQQKPPISENSATLDDVYGQESAKRALVIAAAGHHNLLFAGSPGAGKTMLARTLTTLLPALSPEEQIVQPQNYTVSLASS